jgi:UDP-N-acetylmuramyl pentapeptide phosphotransferase/UDP-N-acetylglucosamine-1-phosphate transferase
MNSAGVGLIVAFSAAISAGLIVMLLPLLRRHALAHPNARSSHRVPTPQGGGIAVIAATVVVAVVASVSRPELLAVDLWLILVAAIFIAIIGAIDDLGTISVLPRLTVQTLAAAAVIATLPADLRIVPMAPWWIERALLLIAYVWFVNLTNFMDGLDWMTVAEFVPLTLAFAILGMSGKLPYEATIAAAALGGALLGFAPFNRPVARLFLGDVGSLPIGLIAGWLLIILAAEGHAAAALILPLYYLADATLTLLQRIANRDPFWRAHRMHFYQRATDRGLRVSGIIVRVFAVNVALAALAAVTVLWPGPVASTLALVAAVALVGGLLHALSRGRP